MVQVTLRSLTWDDSPRLLKWRNQPAIYSNGKSGKPVTLRQHTAWFADRMFYNTDIFIIESDYTSCGVVHFTPDLKDGRAVSWRVSIFITEKFTGKGIGPKAIKLACERIGNLPIYAEFLDGNIYSKRAFRKAGFRAAGKNRMVFKA